jgi:DNA-binding GntR family transcriptional regulator
MKPVVDLSVEREGGMPNMPETTPRLRANLANDIRATLQADIEAGDLAPGAAIDERALAARFNVSRTPVREALQHLAAGELEALCARFCARRAGEALHEALDRALLACQQAAVEGDAVDYAHANALFHDTIYDGSRNECLAEQIRAARRQSARYRVADLRHRTQISRSLQEHFEIARAIQAGDEAKAAEVMRRHVPAGTTGFSEFLAAVPRHFFEFGAD